MIHAYDKLYLEKAQICLGRMLDYAVYELRCALDNFYDMFLKTGIADRFGSGDYTLIVGKSGVELAYTVLDAAHKPIKRQTVRYCANRSDAYWTGWALAYYQWDTALTFSQINQAVPIAEIALMFTLYHEMDIRHFVDHMNDLYLKANPMTNLKRLRESAGLSQRALAESSGIPIRTIQEYEQRRNNINKAQAETLISLSNALFCQIDDLIEKVIPKRETEIEQF